MTKSKETQRTPKKESSLKLSWCVIGKAIIWILIIGAFITLTSISDWHELTKVLFGNITFFGVIRDIVLVIIGIAMGKSFKNKSAKSSKRGKQNQKTENETKTVKDESVKLVKFQHQH